MTHIKYEGIMHKIRIVKYRIKYETYYLATNLSNESYLVKKIKNLYHKRWDIEEFFKLTKSKLKLNKFTVTNENSIIKLLYLNLIMMHILSVFMQSYMDANKNIFAFDKIEKGYYKHINKTMLLAGIQEKIILEFLFNDEARTDINIKKLFDCYVEVVNIKSDRHYERKSVTPFEKWYIKKYH